MKPVNINGESHSVYELIKNKRIFKVDPINAILDKKYYIDLANQALKPFGYKIGFTKLKI